MNTLTSYIKAKPKVDESKLDITKVKNSNILMGKGRIMPKLIETPQSPPKKDKGLIKFDRSRVHPGDYAEKDKKNNIIGGPGEEVVSTSSAGVGTNDVSNPDPNPNAKTKLGGASIGDISNKRGSSVTKNNPLTMIGKPINNPTSRYIT